MNVTQKRPSESARKQEELAEGSAVQPPRFGMQLRRQRRRPPDPHGRNAAMKDKQRRWEAAPAETSLWADASGSSSESESSIVGASAAATAAAQQGERERRKRAQNAFVEYEDKEQRLQRERR